MARFRMRLAALLGAGLLAGCAMGVNVSLPLPGVGSVGIGASSDGRVSGGVSVGRGPVRVGVGGSTRLPASSTAPASAASAASSPAQR